MFLDGLIHDRWSLVTGVHSNVRDPAEVRRSLVSHLSNSNFVKKKQPLLILGDVVQLREAIFQSYPERRSEFQSKRQEYREVRPRPLLLEYYLTKFCSMKQETIRLYDEGNYDLLPLVINRLSHVLLWEHASVSLRIRRGIAKYRLRDLKDALRDLDEAAELSTRGVDGVGGQHAPDVDALRARALVKDEMQYAPPCSSFAFSSLLADDFKLSTAIRLEQSKISKPSSQKVLTTSSSSASAPKCEGPQATSRAPRRTSRRPTVR